MNNNAKIQALADFAVRRGDYRYGSKNYEAYVASLLALSPDEIDVKYTSEAEQDAEREKSKKAALNREYQSQTDWRKNNCKQVTIKFMFKGDADILAALEGKQTNQEIRRLLRLGIAADQASKEDTQ